MDDLASPNLLVGLVAIFWPDFVRVFGPPALARYDWWLARR